MSGPAQNGVVIYSGDLSNPVFKVSNIADCDGNHIQLRQLNK